MIEFDYTDTAAIRALLQLNDFAMCKKFGQNFLISAEKTAKIADAVIDGFDGETIVYEIGPGIGALTSQFVRRGFHVHAFEIDRGFVKILGDFFTADEVVITEGDVLKTIDEMQECPGLICGNLPYNISSVLVARVLETGIRGGFPERMVFLMQREVAQKFTAKCGSEQFSSLSLLSLLSYNARIVFDVGRHCFFPSPNVDSSLVVFDKKAELVSSPAVRAALVRLARILFAQRRKTIRNNMLSAKIENMQAVLDMAGVDSGRRAEELSVDDFVRIAESWVLGESRGLCQK